MSQELFQEIEELRARFIKYTRKAFCMLPKLDKPRILDIGCGSGAPTIELARLSGGEIIGIDTDQSSLDQLNRKIDEEGFSNRAKAVKLSIFDMDFPDESFDVIWSEGSIPAIGFEKGLNEWRRLLKPNGFLVIHDEVQNMLDRLSRMPSLGYRLVGYFSLPEDAWWTEFYRPLERRIDDLRGKCGNDPEALKLLRKFQNEIDMVKGNPRMFASAFCIVQKS
jgi:ubiquinone/menaquinone biosynthesis C-methylase UbiE